MSVLTLGAQAPPSDIPKLDVEKYTLANGLEVILSEDHRVPLVGVDVWYHVGPAHEAPGRTGFAHLFEHMMFQGSKHIESDAHFKLLAGAGATGVNGTTELRSHQLLRDDAVESARARALARVRSHGIPARDGRSGEAVEPAGRRAERAAPELREPAVRHRRGGDVPGAVSQRASLPRRRHRIARRHPGREARRREGIFPAVLRAEQRDDCDRRRHRQGGDQEAHREVLRHAEARAGRSAGQRARRPSSPQSAGSSSKIASSCRASTWRGSRRRSSKKEMPTPTSRAASSARAASAASTRSSSTKNRSRRTSPRISTRRCSDRCSASRRRHGPDIRCRSSRPSSTKRSSCFATKGPTAAEVDRARNVLETQIFNGLQLVGGFGGVADQLNLYNHYVGTPDYLTAGHRAPPPGDARVGAPVRAALSRAERARRRAWHSRKTESRSGSAEAGRAGGDRTRRRPFRSTPTSRGARSSRAPAAARSRAACPFRNRSSCRTG